MVDRPDEDMTDLLRPQVRPLEAIHYRHKGQDMFCLRDPSRLSDRELHVSADVFLIASLFDGERGLTDVQSEVARRVGSPVASADIQKVVDALDNAHFLEGAAFESWRAEVEDEFRAAPVRASVLAGNCYPEDHRDIPKFLDKFFLGNEGPGKAGDAREGATPLRGLVVPHIDLKRGGVSFAHAYKELREAMRPETVVILGVAHAGRGELFTLTRKDYDTPFGRMRTDVEIVDRLAAAAGDGAFADEYSHKGEHSIEIQTVWLEYLWPDAPPAIVPVLCGSLGGCISDGTSPRELAGLAAVAKELGALLREREGRLVILASADLAHIGQKFGDDVPLTPRLIRKNEECDRRMLAFIEAGDADGFFEFVRKEEDRRKVCGLTAIYVTLAACEAAGGRAKGRLLHYAQSPEEETQSLVSYAAVALE
ncbi:MAG: AmmeMemoRadiSam system protein B [Planctomycetota bacterium]